MVPLLTVRETSLFATTLPNVFVMFLSSSMLFRHCIRDLDLSVYDLFPCFFNLCNHIIRYQTGVVVVHRVSNPVFVEAEYMEAALEFAFVDLLYYIVNRVIDTLNH